MAMFKMENSWGGYPQLCTIAGSATFTNASAATANTVVMQSALSQAANAVGAQVGPLQTLSPTSSKVPFVLNPTPAYKPQVATNANNANIIMLDLSGYPGQICGIQLQAKAASVGPAGQINTTPYVASLLDYDQTNKFIYCQILTAAGAVVTPTTGMQLFFEAIVIDSAYP